MKKIFAIRFGYFKLFVILFGSIVGVGFLTGAEIWQYFAKYGLYGYIFAVIVAVSLYFTLKAILLNSSEEKSSENDVNWLIWVSNLFVSGAMMSGLREIIAVLFPDHFVLVYLCSILLIFYIVYKGINKLFVVDLIVYLLVVVIFVRIRGCQSFNNMEITMRNSIEKLSIGLLFSFLYLFMNIISFYNSVRETRVIFTKKSAKIFSLLFSTTILFSIIYISTFLFKNAEISTNSMPFLYYFHRSKSRFLMVYSCGLILSLISTLLASLLCVKNYFKIKFKNFYSSIISIILSSILGLLRFKFFVIVIYPAVGVVSFVILTKGKFLKNN